MGAPRSAGWLAHTGRPRESRRRLRPTLAAADNPHEGRTVNEAQWATLNEDAGVTTILQGDIVVQLVTGEDKTVTAISESVEHGLDFTSATGPRDQVMQAVNAFAKAERAYRGRLASEWVENAKTERRRSA